MMHIENANTIETNVSESSSTEQRKVSYLGGNESTLPSQLLYSAAKHLSFDKKVLLVTDVPKRFLINGNFILCNIDEFSSTPESEMKSFSYVFFDVGHLFTPSLKAQVLQKTSDSCSIVVAA